jgi:hypothetical protein
MGISGIAGGDDWAAAARFADASVPTGGFRAATPIPTVLGKIAVGVDLLRTDNWGLKVQYNGDLSDDYASPSFARASSSNPATSRSKDIDWNTILLAAPLKDRALYQVNFRFDSFDNPFRNTKASIL